MRKRLIQGEYLTEILTKWRVGAPDWRQDRLSLTTDESGQA